MANRSSGPPVILLGGNANALSITRNLGRHGIDVTTSATHGYAAHKSRYCRQPRPIPAGAAAQDYWRDLLLGADKLHGRLVMALDDESVEFLAAHRTELADNFLLDDFQPGIHAAMLDKLETLKLAKEAGVPTPEFAEVDGVEALDQVREFRFPVVIKPVHSHVFRRHYPGMKVLVVNTWEELEAPVREFTDKGLEIIVCEMIPGPDSLLSSYYTYHNADGEALFHYTKRVLRRHKLNCGKATYHISDWLPETAAVGKQFFEGIGYRGLGNVEFKLDTRDGKLKIIECNPRFTDAHELLVQCGIDTALLTYDHVTGRPVETVDAYRREHRLLFPLFDVVAYRQLRRLKQLTTTEWLKSLAFPFSFPFFSVTDPVPFFSETVRTIRSKMPGASS